MKKYLPLIYLFIAVFSFSCKENNTSAETGKVADNKGEGFLVRADSSLITWEATKPFGGHRGTIPLSFGIVYTSNGAINAGNFEFDVRKLTVTDLVGEDKEMLETHLRGTGETGQEDFFNTTVYPKATFEITSIEGIANDKNGNALVKGNLTLKNVTKEISFKANVSVSDELVYVNSEVFEINRVNWGITYQSKNIFKDLKDEFIDDMVKLSVKIKAYKGQGI
jgi:hypothetical protein